MITDDNLYEVGKLADTIDIKSLEPSFSNLPEDTYAEKGLRSRRYSCFRLSKDGALTRLTKKQFMQSKDINDYLGDVQRTYEEIEESLLTNPAFVALFEEMRRRTSLPEDSVIEAHQIRWHCRRDVKMLAPEGTHQDGFDYIAMFMVDSVNVDGGEMMIYPSKNDPPCFKKKLTPGEFIVMSDKKLFHNAAPLVPTVNSPGGHWDLMVLTANARNNSSSAAA